MDGCVDIHTHLKLESKELTLCRYVQCSRDSCVDGVLFLQEGRATLVQFWIKSKLKYPTERDTIRTNSDSPFAIQKYCMGIEPECGSFAFLNS